MTALIEWSDISDERAENDSIEPNDAVEPTESIDPADPTLPIDSTDPTLPIDSTDPRDPMLSSESCDHSDHLELAFEAAMPPSCQAFAGTVAGDLRRPFRWGTSTEASGQAASSRPTSSAISGIRGLVRKLGSAYAARASSGIAAR
jgi:hypothetical protein